MGGVVAADESDSQVEHRYFQQSCYTTECLLPSPSPIDHTQRNSRQGSLFYAAQAEEVLVALASRGHLLCLLKERTVWSGNSAVFNL